MDVDNYDSVDHYLLDLQKCIMALSIENDHLKKQLENKTILLQYTSDALLTGNYTRLSNKRLLQKAKWKFYRENKNRIEVKDAHTYTWYLIKKETDKIFENLDQEQKDKYII